jgi:hypothetical protein
MYWYVSRTKVEALAHAKRGRGPLRSVGLKVKAPVLVEASAELAFDEDLRRDLQRVRKRLDRDPDVRPFDALGEDPGPVFSFEGRAARALAHNAYLLAFASGATALILVGSRWHVMGEVRDVPGVTGSSMGDPLGAILEAFTDTAPDADSLSGLSFAWQAIMREAIPGAVIPKVHGLALFGGSFPVDRRHTRRADGNVTRIVVGSPIYVEQT